MRAHTHMHKDWHSFIHIHTRASYPTLKSYLPRWSSSVVGAQRHCDHWARKFYNYLGRVLLTVYLWATHKVPGYTSQGTPTLHNVLRDSTAKTTGQGQHRLHTFHNSGVRGPLAASPGGEPSACLPVPRATAGTSDSGGMCCQGPDALHSSPPRTETRPPGCRNKPFGA